MLAPACLCGAPPGFYEPVDVPTPGAAGSSPVDSGPADGGPVDAGVDGGVDGGHAAVELEWLAAVEGTAWLGGVTRDADARLVVLLNPFREPVSYVAPDGATTTLDLDCASPLRVGADGSLHSAEPLCVPATEESLVRASVIDFGADGSWAVGGYLYGETSAWLGRPDAGVLCEGYNLGWVGRYDAAGQLEWAHCWGRAPDAVIDVLTRGEETLLAGRAGSDNSGERDGGPPLLSMQDEAFVARVGAGGEWRWVSHSRGAGGFESAWAVTQTASSVATAVNLSAQAGWIVPDGGTVDVCPEDAGSASALVLLELAPASGVPAVVASGCSAGAWAPHLSVGPDGSHLLASAIDHPTRVGGATATGRLGVWRVGEDGSAAWALSLGSDEGWCVPTDVGVAGGAIVVVGVCRTSPSTEALGQLSWGGHTATVGRTSALWLTRATLDGEPLSLDVLLDGDDGVYGRSLIEDAGVTISTYAGSESAFLRVGTGELPQPGGAILRYRFR